MSVLKQDGIKILKGIGDKTEKSFEKLGIRTVNDLISHYPRGYEEYDEIVPLCSLAAEKTAVVEVYLERNIKIKKVRNLLILNALFKDSTGSIMVTWFNMSFLKNVLKLGVRYILRGKIVNKNGILVLEQPDILTKEQYYNNLHILMPLYPLTGGMTNNLIRKTMKIALDEIDLIQDPLPDKIRKANKLCTYRQAIKGIHFPKNKQAAAEARNRLVFDEFFLFMLALKKLKEQKESSTSDYFIHDFQFCNDLIEHLPYSLTNAQYRVWEEIKQDIQSKKQMNRLIQGDVGSGKTVIAALLLLAAAKSGYQGTMMVPTEVLAKQHYSSLTELYSAYDIKVILLVGSMTGKQKKEVYKKIASHEVDIIIGTHTLIQEKVKYDKLAVVITDEQHRFGVKQRENLAKKGENPHILVMSATPIPRTLAIILYGDLDISIIDEQPAGRLPIKNCIVDYRYRKTAYHFIEKEIKQGRQAYIICPMVEESISIEAENVIEYTEILKNALSDDISISYLHGKMKPKEKNDIMEQFSSGKIQVLVSTTVVEVGVNVPNATVMMIENAERFGLAGLHQLRGRVGRGKFQSYCILVSGSESKEIRQRLSVLEKSNDGFYIAQEDLRLRGPGDFFGIRQSGMLEFKIGDVLNDANIMQSASEAVEKITKEELLKFYAGNPALDENIIQHFRTTLL